MCVVLYLMGVACIGAVVVPVYFVRVWADESWKMLLQSRL